MRKPMQYIVGGALVLSVTTGLSGCASVPSNVMLDMLNNGQDIEITMAIPDYEISTTGELQALSDIQLDQLQTYIDGNFRQDFDTLFGIKPIALSNFDSKSGCIYVDKSGIQEGNTSFMDSLRNKVFMETYLGKSEIQSKLAELAEKAYTDVDPDQAEAYLASLNAYYNLLNDNTKPSTTSGVDEYFNATQSLSRGDFYSFVYRSANPVNNLLKTQGDFKTKVATQEPSTLYASQVDQYAWLNADNDGLRAGNYSSSISRAEAVYMIVNMYFSDELKSIDTANINLSDAKDGGTFLEDLIPSKKESDQLYSTEKKSDNKTMAKGWQLGVISKMLKSSDDSVQTDLYKALGVANQLGLIDTETRFNEPLSKSESIELMINTAKALNTRDGYTTEVAEGVSYSEGINAGQGVATDPTDPENQYEFSGDPADMPINPVVPGEPSGNNNNNAGNNNSTTTEKPVTPPTTTKPESKPETKPVTPPASSKPETKPPVTPPVSSKPETPPANNGDVWGDGGGYAGEGGTGGTGEDRPDLPTGWQ